MATLITTNVNGNLTVTGNVGIGTASPTYKFEVSNGTITGTMNPNSGGFMFIGSKTNHPLYFGVYDATRMMISTSGNVGINTTSPLYRLDVTGSARVNSTSNLVMFIKTSSSFGAGISFEDSTTGGNDVVHAGAIGGAFYITTGYSEQMRITSSGNVGIGTNGPGYKLDVSGTIRATGDVIAYSDARVKENIETISNALHKVRAMRGVNYNKIGDNKRSIGVIAQEVLKVLPEVIHQDETGMYSVAYGNIVGVLIEAVKELTKKVEELEAKLK